MSRAEVTSYIARKLTAEVADICQVAPLGLANVSSKTGPEPGASRGRRGSECKVS
jgi:hypothetical protein